VLNRKAMDSTHCLINCRFRRSSRRRLASKAA
jgi:hypothetical protein